MILINSFKVSLPNRWVQNVHHRHPARVFLRSGIEREAIAQNPGYSWSDEQQPSPYNHPAT